MLTETGDLFFSFLNSITSRVTLFDVVQFKRILIDIACISCKTILVVLRFLFAESNVFSLEIFISVQFNKSVKS